MDKAGGIRPSMGRLAGWVKWIMPWASLAAGVVGAVAMDRSPRRAWVVAAAAVGTWGLLFATTTVVLRSRATPPGETGVALRVLRFSSVALTQSLVQVAVFFVLPWYVSAATWTPGHLVFCSLLILGALTTLWDPLFEWILETSLVAVPLLALITFAGLNAVAPLLGVPNGVSLFLGGTVALVLSAATTVITSPDRRRASAAAGVTLVLGSAALFIVGPAAVPAAPLRLVEARIGTRLQGRTVADPVSEVTGRPGMLVCATAIYAPLGLRDRLLHVWRKDGRTYDRIPLVIRGGRKKGFRTWSIKRNFGADPWGSWTCTVETQTGQILGRRRVNVDRP